MGGITELSILSPSYITYSRSIIFNLRNTNLKNIKYKCPATANFIFFM